MPTKIVSVTARETMLEEPEQISAWASAFFS